MAEASISGAEDQVICPICLDLLKEPETIPCGHRYCMSCITDYWNKEDQKRIYSCPQCRQTFSTRPVLWENAMDKVLKMFEKTKVAHSVQSHAASNNVKCDICNEDKFDLVCRNPRCQYNEDVIDKLREQLMVLGDHLEDDNAFMMHLLDATQSNNIHHPFFFLIKSVSQLEDKIKRWHKETYGRGQAFAENIWTSIQNWTGDTAVRRIRTLFSNVLKNPKELNVSVPEPSEMNLHCQSCVNIVDYDQWVHVEPSVSTDEGGSKFSISTPAGRFECSRTRMRWVCTGDVTLHYRSVDGCFLNAELERLQCERIGPVIDVTVISGKLEEAHLPHYACLAESDPSLKDAVKLLSVENEGMTLESVELTRFHARILQPYFSPKTVLVKLGISVKMHCDLLIFIAKQNPIILNVYFFPADSVVAKKIKKEEKPNHQIKCSRPETPLQMMKKHSLEVPGASVQPKEIKLRGDIKPNFFQVKQTVADDIKMTLSRVDDQKPVWAATIWQELTNIDPNKVVNVQQHNTPPVPVNFDKAQFFDRNWSALIKSVTNVNAIADKLLQKQMIHEEIYSEITHPTSTEEESMRKICSIVRKGSVAVKETFISVLLEGNPKLLNHLPLSDS